MLKITSVRCVSYEVWQLEWADVPDQHLRTTVAWECVSYKFPPLCVVVRAGACSSHSILNKFQPLRVVEDLHMSLVIPPIYSIIRGPNIENCFLTPLISLHLSWNNLTFHSQSQQLKAPPNIILAHWHTKSPNSQVYPTIFPFNTLLTTAKVLATVTILLGRLQSRYPGQNSTLSAIPQCPFGLVTLPRNLMTAAP